MRKTMPITAEELVEFRQLLFGAEAETLPARATTGQFKPGAVNSATASRNRLAAELGVTHMSLFRWEQGWRILHPVMLRRALVNLADETEAILPNRLRWGLPPPKPKPRPKR